ncbi:MAG: sugar phosphate isomerase/epimerase [Oscillibacter sp.]|nr:sugar phosphate isomerase/epimerase family protein [uncultured Oscillibacter sp.]MCI8970000.1 sugar phosphate isomerase/epimerase [Oscillibacter sp.]
MIFGHCAQFDEVKRVKSAGYAFVELRGRAVSAMPEADFSALRQELEALELPCLGFNAYCPAEVVIAGPGYDRRRTRSYASYLAGRAGQLGIRQVGIGSPASRRLPLGFDRQLAAKQAETFLADTAECFAPMGVRVALEPLAPFFCDFINTYDEAMEYIHALTEHGVGLILDFLNMELGGEDSRELESLVPHILHVHMSDYAETPWQRDEPKPCRIQIHQERLRHLRSAGYDGAVSIETDLPLDEKRAAETLASVRPF